MKKSFKRISILLVVTLLAPILFSFVPSLKGLSAAEAYAAAKKASLEKTKVTIGVASSPEYIFVKDQLTNAEYTYSSANKKIATVSEDGIILGVAKGKTTITVNESYDGKVKEVGKMSVSVVAPEITKKSVEVGVNNYGFAPINYMNFDATYKYKSSDTKVATIDKYGFITGVKLGNTTISVTETYKGKTTNVGSFTVNVLNGKIVEKQMEVPTSIGYYIEVPIQCKNYKATYQYKAVDSKVVKIDEYGYVTGLKTGSTTISVTETYNKKTIDVGSIQVNVVKPFLDPNLKTVEIGINSTNYFNNLINITYYNWDAEYTCTSANSKIVKTEKETDAYGYSSFIIKGVGLGSTTLTIYESYKGTKRKLGTVKAIVKEIPIDNLICDSYWFEEIDGKVAKSYVIGEDYSWDSLAYYFYKEPYNSTTPLVFTSSDEAVATVNENGTVTPVAEGNTVITVSCGKFSFDIQIYVKPGEITEDTEY